MATAPIINPAHVTQDNLKDYLQQNGFPATEYDKVASVATLERILKISEEAAKRGLRSMGVNSCVITPFIEAVKRISKYSLFFMCVMLLIL